MISSLQKSSPLFSASACVPSLPWPNLLLKTSPSLTPASFFYTLVSSASVVDDYILPLDHNLPQQHKFAILDPRPSSSTHFCITFLRPFQTLEAFSRSRRRVQLSQLLPCSLGLQTRLPSPLYTTFFRLPKKIPKESAFVQFLDVAPPQDNVDRALSCTCLR